MSRRAAYHIDARFVISTETIGIVRDICTISGKFIWVDRSTRLRVHTWKGVPGRFCDVTLPDTVDDQPHVCEIGRKVGSYDGNVRWRLSFRPWLKCFDPSRGERLPSLQHPAEGKLVIEEEHDSLVILARWYNAGIWAQSFPQMRYRPDPGSRVGIFMYQWKNWYSFIPGDEARRAGEVWDQLGEVQQCEDIVRLNRMASNMLYDLAVALGWRKLTLKEKAKYGLSPDALPWHRVDGLLARLVARNGSTTGVGQFTLDAASGRTTLRLPAGVCPDCHELSATCHCYN